LRLLLKNSKAVGVAPAPDGFALSHPVPLSWVPMQLLADEVIE
jgi:hypothetical protein